ncbi:hypothetical protein BJY52DRAFT_1421096 [Lactarius psammicola]|nr:hypothetical protein BJY52DRAFT_1421096 [Lactarius psammicola]
MFATDKGDSTTPNTLHTGYANPSCTPYPPSRKPMHHPGTPVPTPTPRTPVLAPTPSTPVLAPRTPLCASGVGAGRAGVGARKGGTQNEGRCNTSRRIGKGCTTTAVSLHACRGGRVCERGGT